MEAERNTGGESSAITFSSLIRTAKPRTARHRLIQASLHNVVSYLTFTRLQVTFTFFRNNAVALL